MSGVTKLDDALPKSIVVTSSQLRSNWRLLGAALADAVSDVFPELSSPLPITAEAINPLQEHFGVTVKTVHHSEVELRLEGAEDDENYCEFFAKLPWGRPGLGYAWANELSPFAAVAMVLIQRSPNYTEGYCEGLEWVPDTYRIPLERLPLDLRGRQLEEELGI